MGALVTLLLSLAPDARLRGIIFWLTGDLNGVTAPWFAGALLLAACVALPAAPQLNVLLRGDATALALGVPLRACACGSTSSRRWPPQLP